MMLMSRNDMKKRKRTVKLHHKHFMLSFYFKIFMWSQISSNANPPPTTTFKKKKKL